MMWIYCSERSRERERESERANSTSPRPCGVVRAGSGAAGRGGSMHSKQPRIGFRVLG